MAFSSPTLRLLPAARAALAAACALLASSARAERLEFRLELPEGREVQYTLALPVRHAGTLRLAADWSANRILAFRLEPPGGAETLRRSGPSPQEWEVEVGSGTRPPGEWQLTIFALAGLAHGLGTLAVDLPESTPTAAPEPPAAAPVDAALAPWLRPRPVRGSLPAGPARVVESVERFRASFVEPAPSARLDECRWQADLLRYAAESRDALLDAGTSPDGAVRAFFARLVDAYEEIEAIRRGEDPFLGRPATDDPVSLEAWLRVRRERIRPTEAALDALGDSLRRGHVPALGGQPWPARLVSCMTACERHFEERGRLGDERATNRTLALAQWEHIGDAAEILAAFAELAPSVAHAP